MSKRILLTLPDETYNLVKKCEGLGKTDSEKIKGIVISWLSEKSMITTQAKKKL